MQNPAFAKTLIIVGILIVLVSGLADPLGLGGILALGGYRGLGSSSARWSSWEGSTCGAGGRLPPRSCLIPGCQPTRSALARGGGAALSWPTP